VCDFFVVVIDNNVFIASQREITQTLYIVFCAFGEKKKELHSNLKWVKLPFKVRLTALTS